MRTAQFTSLVALLSTVMFSSTFSAPVESTEMAKPVYLEFKEMNETFTEFKKGQSGDSPDYNQLAYQLNQLSTTADSAFSLLQQDKKKSLEPESVSSIGESLTAIANSSDSVQAMAQKGKSWFTEKKVTEKVVQIIQLNAFQYYTLFTGLTSHVDKASYKSYGKSMSTIVCSFVTAAQTLDPKTFNEKNDAVTYCVNYKAGLRGTFDTDGFDPKSISPEGLQTCGNSVSRFLDAAYKNKSLGTNKTKCTGENVGIMGPSLPKDALGLNDKKR